MTTTDSILSALSALSADELATVLSALSIATATATTTTATATTATATATATALAALTDHNAAQRKTYKLTADNTLASLTLDGVYAYYTETVDEWAAMFAGSAYAVAMVDGCYNVRTNVKANKRGSYLEVIIKSANYGTIHITTNSTTSIDYRRLTASYVKKCDNRAARAASKSANTGRRAPMSDVKRAAQAVNRYAAAAVKRLSADDNANAKLRTMVTNHLSSVCIERDVDRDDVIAALNDATRNFIS